MRRGYLIAGSVLAVGTLGIALRAASSDADSDLVAAQISGAPLQPASEISTFSNLPAAIPAAKKPAPPQDYTVDLSSIELDGDRYVAKLSDGRRATLTLDKELQDLAEDLLVESRAPRAAIVAMAPDGRILALAGRRAAKPTGSREGAFEPQLATDVWAPAASIFKLATATALVQAGVDPGDRVCFHGGLRSVDESNLRDSKRDSRCESLAFGVAHSNNAILGKLAYQKLDPGTLERAASALQWTRKLPGLGNIGELTMPHARDLEMARVAAGFTTSEGGAKLSVLGGALVAATFANDGSQPAPRLVAEIDGVPVPAAAATRAIAPTTARAVARMMMQTCDDGSAARSFGKRRTQRVAGKTGTLTRTEPFYMEHSWFVGFAPVEQPKIIVSVLFGNPENWHLRGQEAARRLIDRATLRAKDRKRRS